MVFLVDMEAKKANLLVKLKSLNFSLTEEEEFILQHNIEIKKVFYSLLSQGREVWNDDSKNLFLNTIEDTDMEHIDEKVFYYLLLEEIDSGDLTLFEDTLSYISNQEEVLMYFLEKLEDLDYQPMGDLSRFFVESFIEKNRYDLFGNFQALEDLQLSQEEVEKIVENYPYDLERLPFETSSIERIDLEKRNVYDLFYQLSLTPESDNIVFYLKRKFFSSNVDFREIVIYSEVVPSFYELLTPEEKEKFLDILLKNRQLELYIGLASKKEINQNLSIIIDFVKKRGIDSDTLLLSPFLLENRDFVDALLEIANLKALAKSPLLDEYIPKVIDKISRKEEGYREFIYFDEEFIHIWFDYPEVFRVMIRNCISEINSFYPKIKDTYLESILWEEIIENGVAVRVPSVEDTEQTLRKYIIAGNINGLLRNNHHFLKQVSENSFFELSSVECNQLIDSIQEDVRLQNEVLTTLPALVFSNPAVLDFYLHSYSELLERTLDYIQHHENLRSLYTDCLYDTLKNYFATKYHYRIDHLDQIEKNFGPMIIYYIRNENLVKIANLEDNQFQKLIALFPNTSFTMSLVEAVYDSIKQYAFSREYPEVIEIFSRIKHSVDDHNENVKQDLEKLSLVMNEKFYSHFSGKYPTLVEYCKKNPLEFLHKIVHKMGSNDLQEKEMAINILHTITTYYISWKREEYRSQYHMLEDLHMPYELDSKDLEKKLMLYILKENKSVPIKDEFGISCYPTIVSIVIEKLVESGMEASLASDVIQYYVNKEAQFHNDEKVIKENIRFLISIMKNVMASYLSDNVRENYIEELDKKGLIKRKYYIPSSELDRYQVLTTLRLDSLKNHILADNPKAQIIYQSLLATMNKYKLHVMPSCFKPLLDSEMVQIPSDLENIGAFISYYHQVYEEEEKRLKSRGESVNQLTLNIANILIHAGALSSVSNVYKQFLGTDAARLIQMNPGPNKATNKTVGNQRLKEAVDWTLKNFQKIEITIPSFSTLIEVGTMEKRKMRVVVGNFTHPSNITHGERTGSCMRIGGVGESLFYFCLEDKNGFHIRFEDADTEEYISRVSGFRNGNTVFLNELRYSCNPDLYSDEDIIDACTKISQIIIEKSKDSTYPIDNVVVHKAYATQDLPAIDLKIYNNKQGLKNFYTDIQNSGIVLATTSKPFVPICFDKTNIPSYAPAREKAYVGSNATKLMDMMNRVHSVKLALLGANYEYIEPLSISNEIIYGMASQDWYICLDDVGNVYSEIITVDKRAEKELAIACRKMRELLAVKKVHENVRYHAM